ncbi:MAG: DNA polymerase III subunit epsilon [Proteobacteria bacterium]|nr:DNA polymerase III subunit epsilon [Pseudomonadota bacterium]
MRELVLDTETTGLDPKEGHRIVEIGAVEVINRVPTGRTFHHYINPERDIDAESTRIHGITNEKVRGMPTFAQIADDFLAFADGAGLVIHNAPFDMGFLNYELDRIGKPPLENEVVDTIPMARKRFPGAQVNLDALCRRFEVDLSARIYHGALLDAQLLAEVYLELTGGRQPGLSFDAAPGADGTSAAKYRKTVAQPARSFALPAEELAAHEAFVAKMGNSLWLKDKAE